MAIALLQATTNTFRSGFQNWSCFGAAVGSGQLLIVFTETAYQDTGVAPTAPDGSWVKLFELDPYEGNKAIVSMWAKISTGSGPDGGSDGCVGPFDNTQGVMGSRWSGLLTAPVVRSSELGSAEVVLNGVSASRTRTVTVPTGGLMIAAVSDRFGNYQNQGPSDGTQLTQRQTNGGCQTIAYKLGSGSQSITMVDQMNADHWTQLSAVALGEPPPAGVPVVMFGGL